MAELSFTQLTTTSFRIYVNSLRTNVGKTVYLFDFDKNNNAVRDSVSLDATFPYYYWDINDVSPNTTYNVKVTILYDDGDIQTLEESYPPTSNGSQLSLTNITSTSFDVEVSGMYQSNKIIRIYLNGNDNPFYQDTSIRYANETSATISLTGLTPDTSYEVEVQVIYTDYDQETLRSSCTTLSGGGSSPSDVWTVRNWATMYNLSSTDSVRNTLNAGDVALVKFSCVNSGTATLYSAGSVNVVGYLCNNTSSFDTTSGIPTSQLAYSDNDGVGNNFEITYKVTAGREYYLWVRGYSSGYSGTVTINIYPPEGSTTNRPSYFAWDAPKVSGAAFNITASEWRNLLDNINEVCVYRGLFPVNSTSNPSAIDSFYYPSKGDEFKATMYNQCIYQFERLGLISYSDYSVKSGENITAVRINFLRDTINDVE